MIHHMKSTLLGWLIAAVLTLASPAVSLGQDDEIKYNARLDGYAESVKLEEGSTALTWLLLIGLGIICFSVLFKNAKRTHLD
jgi:hypothetical protein